MIIVVMGVAGAGKTTVGTMLADALRGVYLEADSLHSPENIAKMTRGEALSDADRAPWLAAVHAHLVEAHDRSETLVAGCSALRQSYRETLAQGVPVVWVYLRGSPALLRDRLRRRLGHFADERLLDSQLATLEEPTDAIVMDIKLSPQAIVDQVLLRVSGRRALHIVDARELGERMADAVATTIREVVGSTGRCSLVLSGGKTPIDLHRALATRHRDDVPWPDVHVFWSDERYVPTDDTRSNYGMALETLLDHVPCPPSNIHPMTTTFRDPSDAARAYEATLAAWFDGAPPSFDLTLLGMGADGHTASLFPQSSTLDERERAVVDLRANAETPVRLTLTLPVLLASARNWFLVAGAEKSSAVRDLLSAGADPRVLPAAALLRARGEVVWWLDRDAAAQLDRETAGRAAH
jgi:6-phosphogluconolactonase